jgi:hypothetical protein
MMNKMKVVLAGSAIFAIALFSMPEKSFAYSDLSTGWVTVNGNRDECMRRATATISTERKGGEMSRSQDTVKWHSEDENVIISCVSIPSGKSIAFIAVTADRGASRLRDILFNGIKTGGPYE